MIYKAHKLFLKVTSSFELILFKILFISIIFLYSGTSFSMVINIEKNLAYKYCDSIEKNLFKGLENERILKYEYFFNSSNIETINEEIKDFKNFSSKVESICSYKLSIKEKENIKKMLNSFLLNNK